MMTPESQGTGRGRARRGSSVSGSERSREPAPSRLRLAVGVSRPPVGPTTPAGARTVAEIERMCGAGGDCGACSGLIEALVEQARERHYAGATIANTLTGGRHEGT